LTSQSGTAAAKIAVAFRGRPTSAALGEVVVRKEEREGVLPNQPALVVTYGHTTRKCRPLDADILTLGRNATCDFSLVAPEVAPVHCILVRAAEGWRLRDCSGRPGTRVNGKVIQEVRLDDGDVIQVGAFSFEVHLPGQVAAAPPPLPPSRVARLEKARRNLLHLALRLRKRLGDRALAVEAVDARLITQRAEVAQQVDVLKARQREFELRMTRLELSERDLATDRATLDREYRAFQDDVGRHAATVRLFEERVALKEKELEERQQALAEGQRPALEAEPAEDGDRQRQLDQRSRELDHYAQHLRRLSRNAVEGSAAPLPDRRRDTKAELLAQAEAVLCKQQTQFERLVAEMRQLLEESREEQRGLAERLQQENEQLRELVEVSRTRSEVVRPRPKRGSGLRERRSASGK